MAYVSTKSETVVGSVAGESIMEGRAIVIGASGLRNDLPVATYAPAGTTTVFLAIIPPDRFPRPTPVGMYNAPESVTFSQFGMTLGELTTDYLFYRIGPSQMEEPTAASGWLLQAHTDGMYTITSGCYVDSANIRLIGSKIRVTGSGRFEYTASGTDAVGYVREYRNGKLTIALDQRVS
jgi:hypothetical protein